MAIEFLHFLVNLIMAGFLIRYIQMKFPETPLGKALSYVY